MADVIVRDDPVLELVTGNPPISAATDRAPEKAQTGLSRAVAVAVGLGCAAILFAYFVTGSVRIEAGTRSGVRYRIETIWSDFSGYLVRQGASPELVTIIAALAVLSVLGSCLLIGLAFAIRNETPNPE
jgi:hypothetical protein